VRRIDRKIANVSGFSYLNTEYYQLLRYIGRQGYQAHSDWVALWNDRPSGPRIFTFFMYLNDVAEADGGATWWAAFHS
jgi:hypothetical protein